MKTSEILNLSADKIREHGWTTGGGGWSQEGAGLCLEGGLAAAMQIEGDVTRTGIYEEFQACPAYRAVWDYLQTDERWGTFRSSVYDWNDANGRTADEVIEVLRACAVIEEARENAEVKVLEPAR